MKDLKLEEEILKYCYSSNGKINNHSLKNLPAKYKEYLESRFDYIESISEALFRLKNGIEVRPSCKICNKPVRFYGKLIRPYSDTCSIECAKELNKLNRYKTNLERYGDVNPAKNSKIKEKQRNIYRSKEKDIIEKRNNTLKEKYGVENSFQINEVKEKLKEIWIDKYGVDNPAKSEIIKDKIKETNIERYGSECVFSSKEMKSKFKEIWLDKYGVDNPAKSEIIQNKINNTKTKNGTHNTSIPENESYILLKEKYPDIIRQYKSKLYPFNCDFYIPSLDLYIECNYSWTHGYHPFNENNVDDINLLNNWKSHNTSFYNSAIKCWTISDVKKRNIAKENHLNWLEFYNIDDLKEWLKDR